MMEQDMQEILFTPEALAQRVKELADQITQDYSGISPLIVVTLRGSFLVMADLVLQINFPLTGDFLSASSYGSGTESSGQVKLKLDLADDISGRDVLIIEDIVDSGNTLSKLLPELQTRGPASLKVCALLEDHYRDMQDMEFTVENGKLYMLQTRNGKRTAPAALKIACDLVDEGMISEQQAVAMIDPRNLDTLLHPEFDPKAV